MRVVVVTAPETMEVEVGGVRYRVDVERVRERFAVSMGPDAPYGGWQHPADFEVLVKLYAQIADECGLEGVYVVGKV